MIMPRSIIPHNILFLFTFLYLMVSPHVSYAEQANYKALDPYQSKISKKIAKDDNLPDIPFFIYKTQTNYFARFKSIQACLVLLFPSPTQSLSTLSMIRLLLWCAVSKSSFHDTELLPFSVPSTLIVKCQSHLNLLCFKKIKTQKLEAFPWNTK